MSSSYRNSLNEWLAELDVKAKTVIDIGGSQEPLPKRVKSWKVKKYLIADLPEPHKDSPKPDIELDLNKPYMFNTVQGDMVFCLEVFDYVWNPVVALYTIKTFMKPGAKAWITFPSVYPLHQPIEDDALRYMPAAIRKLAESVDLKIVEMIPRRAETDLWDQFVRAERMRAAKHEDHNFTGWIVCLQR